MTSTSIINAVKTVIAGNVAKVGSFIQNIRGGWEIWLQVETAYQLRGDLAPGANAAREIQYPGILPAQFCDIQLTPRMGTVIYMELKVQNAPADDILTRFQNDITKVRAIAQTLTGNVLIAIAYMESFNTAALNTMRMNHVRVYQYVSPNWNEALTAMDIQNGRPTIAVYSNQ
jgi:hypothetical protein